MNLKHIIITLTFSVCFLVQLSAQRGQNRSEKMDALKIAFITEQLDLTTEEWQKFWPIYNKHEKVRKAIEEEKRSLYRKNKSENPSAAINSKFDLDIKLIEQRREFVNEIMDVTSPETAILLIEAEQEFKKSLLNRFKKRGRKSGI